ncbi:hypothetical protein WJX74_007317 [Apatococcus lobatus]|uniref:Transmembrane protein n=1 Tax=Apatococcus lobatus TaxID=904363 RepID=A0AAW1QC87_9CHLO
MWLEDVLYGALAKGVNRPTVVVLNVALGGCILSLLSCFCLSWSSESPLTIHFGFLLVLASLLLITINWFINEIGTVELQAQQQELFGPSQQTAPGPTAAASQTSLAHGKPLKQQ